jgi:hypothetical protein
MSHKKLTLCLWQRLFLYFSTRTQNNAFSRLQYREKAEGVVLAYRVLGKLFCCQHKKPLPLELLSHFYRVVQNVCAHFVLNHCKHISYLEIF